MCWLNCISLKMKIHGPFIGIISLTVNFWQQNMCLQLIHTTTPYLRQITVSYKTKYIGNHYKTLPPKDEKSSIHPLAFFQDSTSLRGIILTLHANHHWTWLLWPVSKKKRKILFSNHFHWLTMSMVFLTKLVVETNSMPYRKF